jgi:hypothetical protein
MKRLFGADCPTSMQSESWLVGSKRFIDGVYRYMALVVKETLREF